MMGDPCVLQDEVLNPIIYSLRYLLLYITD
jgi:hypothetical protein